MRIVKTPTRVPTKVNARTTTAIGTGKLVGVKSSGNAYLNVKTTQSYQKVVKPNKDI